MLRRWAISSVVQLVQESRFSLNAMPFYRIPCVKLRNFRSKFVGETEGNLEHVLTVLRSLGPVVVIIDEATLL